MEIRVLQYFLTVAQEGSITKAAETLHMTQPPLSRQIRDLEEELGVQLFTRGRRVELTEDGLRLRQRAMEMVDLMAKTRAEFASAREGIGGEVWIGCGETEGMRPVARVIRTLQENYPQIVVHLSSGNFEDLTERLDRGLFDFCVLFEPCDYTKYDHIRLPGRDRWGLVMRRDSPLAERKSIRPEDLMGLPLIASRQSIAHNELSRWLGRDMKQLRIVSTYNLLYNASLLVEEGAGYLLCLEGILRETENERLCFRPLEPRADVGLEVVWKKYRVFSRAAEAFLTELKRQLEEDGPF